MRDYATIEQLIVLANIESLNAVLLYQGLSQADRLDQPRRLDERLDQAAPAGGREARESTIRRSWGGHASASTRSSAMARSKK